MSLADSSIQCNCYNNETVKLAMYNDVYNVAYRR